MLVDVILIGRDGRKRPPHEYAEDTPIRGQLRVENRGPHKGNSARLLQPGTTLELVPYLSRAAVYIQGDVLMIEGGEACWSHGMDSTQPQVWFCQLPIDGQDHDGRMAAIQGGPEALSHWRW